MTRNLRALAFAGAMAFASSAALGQTYAPGAVLGNGTATNPQPGRVTDVLLVLKQKAGTTACVFRESAGSVACGTIATGGITDAAVTDAKISNRTALSVFGRSANSSGVGADIAAGTDGHVLRRSGTSIGFGLLASGAFATAPGIVTPAMLDNGTALSLLGRSANSSGARADISAVAASGCAFRESGSSLACGTLATAAYAANSVTNAKLAQMVNNTVKGNVSGGTADPSDLTATQITALLNNCVGDSGSGGTKGAVPAAGAGDAAAAKFLKADCTWAVPAGGGGSGMATTERQNFALSLAYQSKAFAGYRRLIHLFADGYKASDGISSALSINHSVDTTNGRLSPDATAGSDQTSGQTFTASQAATDGALANLFSDTSAYWGSGSDDTQWITIQFTSGGARTITSYTLTNVTVAEFVRAPTAFTLKASNTGSFSGEEVTLDSQSGLSAWTSGQVRTFSFTNTTAYSYYRLTLTAKSGDAFGKSSEYYLQEIELLSAGTTNNMVATTTPQTASASRSSARVLLEYNPVDAITLNTDLVVHVTCALSTATVTISNASPGVITHTAHGLSANDPVYFTTSGALPTGLTASTQYFVKTVSDANSYTVSATIGGTAINTSSAGSGTHTANYYLWASATLSSAGTGQAGRTVAETSSTTCTASGTTLAARIKSLNNKSLQIYGVAFDFSS